jgi:predicted methyltransferase
MKALSLALFVSLILSSDLALAGEAPEVPAHVAAAVAATSRPSEDRDRDADRRPADVLTFFGIEAGATVAELMTGRGYYAEILARAVGPNGKVYAQNNAFVLEKFAEQAITDRLAKPGLENVVRLDREIDDPGLPAGELDAVLMILFYHDTYWMEADRAAMNKAIFDALKPGGLYGVIDHHAEAGSGARDVKSLHRLEAALAEREILAAGFVLEASSELLHHPEDDRTKNVFDESIRGKTDRFIFKFRKPATPVNQPIQPTGAP